MAIGWKKYSLLWNTFEKILLMNINEYKMHQNYLLEYEHEWPSQNRSNIDNNSKWNRMYFTMTVYGLHEFDCERLAEIG